MPTTETDANDRQTIDFTVEPHFQSLGNEFALPVTPAALHNPCLIKRNEPLMNRLGFHPESSIYQNANNLFSGNANFMGYSPVAQQYAGHQFGNFNPFLGDGRSALVAEITTTSTPENLPTNPTKNQHWQLSIKGIGPTPFSYQGDGHASLNECLHEYECSQRLAAFKVPTVQALCVIKGEQHIYRHGFQDSAMLTRVAPSFVRFGTFELFYFQRNTDALRALADHVIRYHYTDSEAFEEKKYAHFFKHVVINTAQLIAHWQSVGFVHGMMNTDNQSILGITLDFGSCAFTENFDDAYISAKLDTKGRYAFGQQPTIGLWNCNVLAKALSPLISAKDLKQALLCYEPAYLKHYELLTS